MIAGVAAMSAFEAHVINVTAHIENALNVHPKALEFGTVFPQEYQEKQFTVELSSSFNSETGADSVTYVIKQKPKCWDKATHKLYAPVDYATHLCPADYEEMLSLCPFLSKVDSDPADANDTSHPSYFVKGTTDSCDPIDPATPRPDATGTLDKPNDLADSWTVDLKVPPVAGYVGQDWPASCKNWVVSKDGESYGCDLWIEVTGITRIP